MSLEQTLYCFINSKGFFSLFLFISETELCAENELKLLSVLILRSRFHFEV